MVWSDETKVDLLGNNHCSWVWWVDDRKLTTGYFSGIMSHVMMPNLHRNGELILVHTHKFHKRDKIMELKARRSGATILFLHLNP